MGRRGGLGACCHDLSCQDVGVGVWLKKGEVRLCWRWLAGDFSLSLFCFRLLLSAFFFSLPVALICFAAPCAPFCF